MSVNDAAIRVEGLGKRYRIGEGGRGHQTFRERLSEIAAAPLRRWWGERRQEEERDFWALREVSFEVKKGEVLGVIGRNGAGKSTLLKILARITEPTEGRAEIRGRVGSLLEVGTGFHPELTGRDNIYLNGAILGMKRAEIERRFDEIVAFAEVEKFIDTPVKRYSSGMYLRLAFAVAAHLEPEILLVDEVLAVGDAAFQKRCLARMESVAGAGRTILFVSHNLAALQSLCSRAVWVEEGRVKALGPATEMVFSYLQSSSAVVAVRSWDSSETAPGNAKVRLRRASITAQDGSLSPFSMRQPLRVAFDYENLAEDALLNLSVHLRDAQGAIILNTASVLEPEWHGRPFSLGRYRSEFEIPGDLLNVGLHRLDLLLVHREREVVHRERDLLTFEIVDTGELRGAWKERWPGAVHPQLPWRTERLEGPDPKEGECGRVKPS